MPKDNPLIFEKRTRVVPLLGGDAEQRVKAALDAITEAEMSKTPRRANQPDPLAAAKKAYRDEVAAVEASATMVTLTEIPARRRNRLLDDCPPRKDNAVDLAVGYNREKFWWDSLRAMMTDPVLDDDDWQAFVEDCSEWNSEALGEAMAELRAAVDVPKSSLVSAYMASETG